MKVFFRYNQKMTNKKQLAITFGITGNWAFALGNVLIGLKKHNPSLNADIILFFDNLSLKDRFALKKIYPDIQLRKYKFPYETKDINNINIFSEMAFSRYECFNLLNKYKKVVWLDVDIVIQNDITKLFEYSSNKGIALFANGKKLLKGDFNVDYLENFDLNALDFGSGTMVLSDNLKNFNKIALWCYEKTQEYSRVITSPDQAIINLALQKFDLQPEKLDKTYVFHPSNTGWQNAKILHAYYGKKFWNGLDNEEWNTNNQEWLMFDGTPYDENWDYFSKPNFLRQPSKFFRDFKKRYVG